MLAVVRRHPQFRRLWLAQVVSQAGDWLCRIALLSLIGRLSGREAVLGTGALFGAELAIRLLPVALLGPLAGPVADRLPRRALMIAADLARAAVVLGYLLVDEPGELPLLYTLLVVQMSIAIFFDSARAAALPNTVVREDLHAAYALSAATWSMMLAVGSITGGLFVRFLGLQGVFVADAITYLLSGAILLRLTLPPTPRQPEPFRWRDIVLGTDLRRGLAHVRTLGLTPVLFAKTFWGAAGGFLVILSIAGSRRFSSGVGGAEAIAAAGFATGVLFSARGVGTGLGPVLARRWFGSSDAALWRQIAGGFVLGALGYTCFTWLHSLPLAFLAVAVAHSGGSILWVASTTWWQRHVDDAFRGRVFALEFLGMTVAFSAGGLIAGTVYDLTGALEPTVLVTCALVLVAGLSWSWFARRVLPAPAPEQ